MLHSPWFFCFHQALITHPPGPPSALQDSAAIVHRVQIVSETFLKVILSNAKTKCQCLGLGFFLFWKCVLWYRWVLHLLLSQYASYLSTRHFSKSLAISNLTLLRNISKCCPQCIFRTDIIQELFRFSFLTWASSKKKIQLVQEMVEYFSLAEREFRLQKILLGSGFRFGVRFC